MIVLAIDPGPVESAYVIWDGAKIIDSKITTNEEVRSVVRASTNPFSETDIDVDVVAVEMIASYGMAVGKEVFETCLQIGRFQECITVENRFRLVYRRDVKLHHCGTSRATDSNVRQSLIDKHGSPGTKKAQGRTYGLKSHLWQAFAIATFISETNK